MARRKKETLTFTVRKCRDGTREVLALFDEPINGWLPNEHVGVKMKDGLHVGRLIHMEDPRAVVAFGGTLVEPIIKTVPVEKLTKINDRWNVRLRGEA